MHRVRQFAAHVRARVTADERAFAHHVLPPPAARLWDGMPVADRRHGIDVAHRLIEAGHDEVDLLAAALLHDAAKGHRMRLWHRVAGVLLEAFAPKLLRRLSTPDPASWRHPFFLYLHHADLSAGLAIDAGCSERAASLIRGSPAEADVRLWRALEAADDAS